MNKITATYQKSKYSNSEHFVIQIDGQTLDSILEKFYPGKSYLGLVPTLLDWLEDKKERELVWERIQADDKAIVPILMCPDDIDLWCTVIVVEVKKREKVVLWSRMGVDVGGSDNLPNSIGTSVEWFDKIPSYEFELDDYQKFISIFKNLIEIDEVKQKIKKWVDEIDEAISNTNKDYFFQLTNVANEFQILHNSSNTVAEKNESECLSKLNLGSFPQKWDEQKIQDIVVEAIKDIIEIQLSPLLFVHTAESISIGYKGSNVLKIEKNEIERLRLTHADILEGKGEINETDEEKSKRSFHFKTWLKKILPIKKLKT